MNLELFPHLPRPNVLRFSPSRYVVYSTIVLAIAELKPDELTGLSIALTRLQREQIFSEIGLPADRNTLIGFPLEVI